MKKLVAKFYCIRKENENCRGICVVEGSVCPNLVIEGGVVR